MKTSTGLLVVLLWTTFLCQNLVLCQNYGSWGLGRTPDRNRYPGEITAQVPITVENSRDRRIRKHFATLLGGIVLAAAFASSVNRGNGATGTGRTGVNSGGNVFPPVS